MSEIEQLRAMLRQIYGMAQEGCDAPNAAYRWCERIDEVLHAGRAVGEFHEFARDVPKATDARLSAFYRHPPLDQTAKEV